MPSLEGRYESAVNNIEIKKEPLLEGDRIVSKVNDAAGENDDKSSPREDCGFSSYDRKRN